jgi:hypothetical protein
MQARDIARPLLLCSSLLAIVLSPLAAARRRQAATRVPQGFVDGYIAALAQRDPKKLAVADGVKYTENGRVLDLGEGFWRTAGTPLRYRDYLLDRRPARRPRSRR